MKKWKIIRSEYLYKTPFGNLRKDCCKLPSGGILDTYYVNEYTDWVNAVVITKENQIVLVEQYRHPGQDIYLEIPAGKIEVNESYEEGILREVREETGFTSKTKPILLGEFMVNPATQDNKVVSYLILDAYQVFDQELDVGEDVMVKLINFDQIEGMIKQQKITQLFTVSAYYMVKDYLHNKISKSYL
ncbi:NUDIX hydrolase [Fictibacillus nanhaiensis]|uniref:NUDIX hydrolase n=1 Tax=Fictibacillus nanhaiensis TaxID=742169 RepID=UPI001C981B5B|nr:NUDIX hydrolase [Fictibacillus nanhaiensis]MBY6036951.1 NUDIX hydrolase [Fictibacillus nanhaiensis]